MSTDPTVSQVAAQATHDPSPAGRGATGVGQTDDGAGSLADPGMRARNDEGSPSPAAAAPTQEAAGEPVAWIQPDHLAKARVAPFLCRVEPTQRADFVPLYTSPRPTTSAQEVVEALQELVEHHDQQAAHFEPFGDIQRSHIVPSQGSANMPRRSRRCTEGVK